MITFPDVQTCRSLAMIPLSAAGHALPMADAVASHLSQQGESLLRVDLGNGPGPANWQLGDISSHLAIESAGAFERLDSPSSPTTAFEPDLLVQALLRWYQGYERVLINTAPLLGHAGKGYTPNKVARCVDGVVLCVRAGLETEGQLREAVARLQGSNLVGVFIDDQSNPSLGQRLSDALGKRHRLSGLQRWLQKNPWINGYLGQ
ncbi:hypothetical protein KUV89_02600 [Marinobacter hydrocarbonoclasticus]|nr:hypothetical protein [Marinobacter nauticus]